MDTTEKLKNRYFLFIDASVCMPEKKSIYIYIMTPTDQINAMKEYELDDPEDIDLMFFFDSFSASDMEFMEIFPNDRTINQLKDCVLTLQKAQNEEENL